MFLETFQGFTPVGPEGMGGGASKSAAGGAYAAADSAAVEAARKAAFAAVVSGKKIFDAHCHYFSYLQETEGMETLSRAMEKNGVGYAVLTGTPFKKTWMGKLDAPPPAHHLYDDGDLYYYSATDGNLYRHLMKYGQVQGDAAIGKFSMLGCGMNLGDYSCGDEAKAMLSNYPGIVGFGELVLQCDDINNMTIKGGNWTYTEPAIKKIMDVAEKPSNKGKPLPVVIYSDARSVSTKPYRSDFEYLDEIEMVCSHNPKVNILWVNAGASTRGIWTGYPEMVKMLIKKFPNLYLSFGPELVMGKVMGISREDCLKLAEELPHRIVLGTTSRGLFEKKPSEAFGEVPYAEQCKALKYFADQIETLAGKGPTP